MQGHEQAQFWPGWRCAAFCCYVFAVGLHERAERAVMGTLSVTLSRGGMLWGTGQGRGVRAPGRLSEAQPQALPSSLPCTPRHPLSTEHWLMGRGAGAQLCCPRVLGLSAWRESHNGREQCDICSRLLGIALKGPQHCLAGSSD